MQRHVVEIFLDINESDIKQRRFVEPIFVGGSVDLLRNKNVMWDLLSAEKLVQLRNHLEHFLEAVAERYDHRHFLLVKTSGSKRCNEISCVVVRVEVRVIVVPSAFEIYLKTQNRYSLFEIFKFIFTALLSVLVLK